MRSSIVTSHNLEPNATSKHSTKFRTLIYGSQSQISITQLLPRDSTDSQICRTRPVVCLLSQCRTVFCPGLNRLSLLDETEKSLSKASPSRLLISTLRTCHLLECTVTFHGLEISIFRSCVTVSVALLILS
jgi:hypothetical protein